jgi:RNA polymerase sigma-70 factor (ECF subfamily)
MADDRFASFYASSYRRLLGQLFALTGDLAEAENVLHEAYDRPEAWVRRVAINLVGLPVEEVASELRLATGTVKSRLARAGPPWPAPCSPTGRR